MQSSCHSMFWHASCEAYPGGQGNEKEASLSWNGLAWATR